MGLDRRGQLTIGGSVCGAGLLVGIVLAMYASRHRKRILRHKQLHTNIGGGSGVDSSYTTQWLTRHASPFLSEMELVQSCARRSYMSTEIMYARTEYASTRHAGSPHRFNVNGSVLTTDYSLTDGVSACPDYSFEEHDVRSEKQDYSCDTPDYSFDSDCVNDNIPVSFSNPSASSQRQGQQLVHGLVNLSTFATPVPDYDSA